MSETSSNGDGERLPNLPQGWIRAKLIEICNFLPTGVEKFEGVADYYSTGSIKNQTFTTEGQFSFDTRPSRANRLSVESDVLQARMKGTNKAIIIKKGLDKKLFSTGFIQLRPYNCCKEMSTFLYYFVQSWIFLSQRDSFATGSTQTALTDDGAKKIFFLLPPLSEQKRIVVKLDELITQMDAGVISLKKVRAQLKRYRQTVLKAAFEGKLTQVWRDQHQGEIEGADELLKKIKQDRRKKTEKNEKTTSCIKQSILPELPPQWMWVKNSDIFFVKPGGTPSRKNSEYWGSPIPWVSSGEVANCIINSTNESITELGVQNSNAKPNPIGTVLLAMIGEGKTRGQCAILNLEAATNQNVAAIRCSETPIPSKYVFYWFLKNYNENREKGSGGMQQALNARIISEMIFPLSPLQEQHEIISEIERHFSQIDHLEQTITTSLRQAETLRQSILKRAFEGRLVPQDPTDEPASILLERIKAEKARHAAEVKKGKTLQHQSPKRKIKNGN